MENIAALKKALDHIEENVCGDITPEETAKHCCYSLSALQKMFRYTFHIGVADYISRRRLTLAARELVSGSSVTDTAMKYGYNSPEVFARAFVRLWGEKPSDFRRRKVCPDIYPRLDFPEKRSYEFNGGIIMEDKCRFDISGLYDRFAKADGTYILSFDICGLMPINDNYGRAAGDIVIAECLKRIADESGEGMLPFRIGGDEFALLTGLSDKTEAEAVGQRILSHNRECIVSGGAEIPVSMRFGTVLIEGKNLRYSELFGRLERSARHGDDDGN